MSTPRLRSTCHRTACTLLLALLLGSTVVAWAQAPDPQPAMSFDFGITRGRNIDFWPILQHFKDTDTESLQILFPQVSHTRNYPLHTKHTKAYSLFARPQLSLLAYRLLYANFFGHTHPYSLVYVKLHTCKLTYTLVYANYF